MPSGGRNPSKGRACSGRLAAVQHDHPGHSFTVSRLGDLALPRDLVARITEQTGRTLHDTRRPQIIKVTRNDLSSSYLHPGLARRLEGVLPAVTASDR